MPEATDDLVRHFERGHAELERRDNAFAGVFEAIHEIDAGERREDHLQQSHRQPETLRKAGIERASAIVCCTQDDLANLDIALDAREMHPDIKIVLRMFDDTLASKVEKGFGIHTAFSMSALSAPAFAAAATRAHIDYSFYVGGTLLHVSQVNIEADSPLPGLTMEDAERKFNMTVVMHQADGQLHLHPTSDEIIKEGDTLVVFATLETLGLIGGMNCVSGHRHSSQNPIKRMLGRNKAH